VSFIVNFILFSVVKKFDNRLRCDKVKANFVRLVTKGVTFFTHPVYANIHNGPQKRDILYLTITSANLN